MDKNDSTIKNEEREKPEEIEEQEKITEEKNEWEEKYKRALADYQNLEKRVAGERREVMLFAGKQVLERFLPVLDTLQLASKHLDDQGLKVSIQQFEDVLRAEGVVRIETKGKKFDPAVMEAVGTGEGEEGKILEEARAGYLLHEKLLRPAQVIVGEKSKN